MNFTTEFDGFSDIVAALQAGLYPKAEQLARACLRADIDRSAGLFLLGHALRGQGRLPEALDAFLKAAQAQPERADIHLAVAEAAAQLERWKDALSAATKAIESASGALDATQVGQARIIQVRSLLATGNSDAAAKATHNALKAAPGSMSGLSVAFAQIFHAAKQWLHAARLYRDALAQVSEGSLQESAIWSNLALVLVELGQHLEAVELAQRARHAQPHHPGIAINLAIVLMAGERYADAVGHLRDAIKSVPGSALGHANLAIAELGLGNVSQALDTLVTALALDSQCGLAWYGVSQVMVDPANQAILKSWVAPSGAPEALLHVLREPNTLAAERAALHAALRFTDAPSVTVLNLAQSSLREGDWHNGWRYFAIRPDAVDGAPRKSLWRPSNGPPDVSLLSRGTVHVFAEQGLGDILFYSRFLPGLISLACDVTLVGASRLHPCLSQLDGLTLRLADDVLPDPDFSLRLGDLPLFLSMLDPARPSLTLPPPLPLAAEAGAIVAARARLAQFGPPPYVGATWRAGTPAAGQRHRHLCKFVPLLQLHTQLLALPCTLVPIQRDAAVAARDLEACGLPSSNLAGVAEEPLAALGLMAALDAYVAVSNTNVHLRASLGLSSHVLVPFPPEWRWGASGNESPWFPGTRVYRQSQELDWTKALECLRRDLEQLFPNKAPRND